MARLYRQFPRRRQPLYTALQIDVSVSTNGTATTGTVTSPSFTTIKAGQVLFALIGGVKAGSTVSTVTGAGLTWTRVIQKTTAGAYSEIWRAQTGAVLTSQTVVATSTDVTDTMALTVLSFINADLTGTGGSAAVGATNSANGTSTAPSVALTTTRADSWVISCGNDFTTGATVTRGVGQIVINQYQTASGDAIWSSRNQMVTSNVGLSVTSNVTLSASDAWNIVAVEVKPAITPAPIVLNWIPQVQQFLRKRLPQRQQPIINNGREPFYGIPPATTPSVASWVKSVNQPLRSRISKRLQVNKFQPPYPAAPSQAPYVSYWKQPVSQFLRSRVLKRQQPPPSEPPVFPQGSQAPRLANWVQPVNQFLRKRTPVRQQPPTPEPPNPPQKSQAPFLAYWVRPTNQYLRNRTPKRQQPPGYAMEPFYQLPVAPVFLVTQWIKPINQFLRSRVPKRQQPPPETPPPLTASQAPRVSYWVKPINQPLRKRVLKRQQPRYEHTPFPPLGSQAPRVSNWKQPVNQPLRSRVPKRQIPPVSKAAALAEATRFKILGWIPPVQQFLRKRVLKRQQPTYTINRGGYNPIPNPKPIWNSPSIIISSGAKTTSDSSGGKVANVTSGGRIEAVSSGTKTNAIQSGTKTTTVSSGEDEGGL